MSIKPPLRLFSHSNVNIILSSVCSLLPSVSRSSWENIVGGMLRGSDVLGSRDDNIEVRGILFKYHPYIDHKTDTTHLFLNKVTNNM